MKRNVFIFFFLLFHTLLSSVQCAKILGVFPFPAKSHFMLGNALLKGLAEKGHDIVMIASHEDKVPPKNGSYQTVYLTGFWDEFFGELDEQLDFFHVHEENSVMHALVMQEYMLKFMEKMMNHPNVQALLTSNEKFDVVIIEKFYNDALLAFAHYFQAPLILFSAIGSSASTNNMMGNPEPFSYIPHHFSSFPVDMNIYQRGYNSILYLLQEISDQVYFLPKQEIIRQKYFPEAPSVYDLYYNASILFTTTHESFGLPVPLVPNIIPIGGFHIKPPKQLPKDVKELLDNAKEGVIYFSLGSNINLTKMPEDHMEALFRSFGKLKQTVLIKWDSDKHPSNKPKNVQLRKWWPQSDLLAHPNIKFFISHGGLLSITESIYHGVPALFIPFFTDQFYNTQLAVTNGFGIKFSYFDFSEEKFFSLISELLHNPKYRENAERRSKVFLDRPMNPIDTANYWVEFVIRHHGAPHLKVAGIRFPWYKYFLVDIISVVVVAILLVLYICNVIFKKSRKSKGGKFKKS